MSIITRKFYNIETQVIINDYHFSAFLIIVE